MLVLAKIWLTATASAADPSASCDAPLNPNQPSHSTNVPSVASGRLEPGSG